MRCAVLADCSRPGRPIRSIVLLSTQRPGLHHFVWYTVSDVVAVVTVIASVIPPPVTRSSCSGLSVTASRASLSAGLLVFMAVSTARGAPTVSPRDPLRRRPAPSSQDIQYVYHQLQASRGTARTDRPLRRASSSSWTSWGADLNRSAGSLAIATASTSSIAGDTTPNALSRFGESCTT